jgi:hypothetical protein
MKFLSAGKRHIYLSMSMKKAAVLPQRLWGAKPQADLSQR